MSFPGERRRPVVMAEIAGVYGVRGWVRVRSYTDPIDGILNYRTWLVGDDEAWTDCELLEGRRHGRGLIARLSAAGDRDSASALVGRKVAVYRDQLPAIGDEIYWIDLEGLEVVTSDGTLLGKVDHLIETGANDVLVIKGERERLVPFVRDDVVKDIDLGAGRITVDWDPEF